MHDFAATPADIPAGSVTAGQYAHFSMRQGTQEIEVDRRLGAQVAKGLVLEIQGMGLPAPQVGDIVIMGYHASRARRMPTHDGRSNLVFPPMQRGVSLNLETVKEQIREHIERQRGLGL